METFLFRNGEQLGPFTIAQLMQMLSDGEIQPEDQIWVESEQAWKNARIHLRTMKGPQRAKPKQNPTWAGIGVLAVVLFVLLIIWKPDSFGAMSGSLGILFIVGLLYFLPSVVAYRANHRNTAGIILVNLFLGWTLIGWVGALVWSVYQDKR